MVGVFVKRWGPKTIPYTIIISTVGAAIGLISQLVSGGLYVHVICGIFAMDPHLIFYIFLPVLIFESSFYADVCSSSYFTASHFFESLLAVYDTGVPRCAHLPVALPPRLVCGLRPAICLK